MQCLDLLIRKKKKYMTALNIKACRLNIYDFLVIDLPHGKRGNILDNNDITKILTGLLGQGLSISIKGRRCSARFCAALGSIRRWRGLNKDEFRVIYSCRTRTQTRFRSITLCPQRTREKDPNHTMSRQLRCPSIVPPPHTHRRTSPGQKKKESVQANDKLWPVTQKEKTFVSLETTVLV